MCDTYVCRDCNSTIEQIDCDDENCNRITEHYVICSYCEKSDDSDDD